MDSSTRLLKKQTNQVLKSKQNRGILPMHATIQIYCNLNILKFKIGGIMSKSFPFSMPKKSGRLRYKNVLK